MENQNTKDIRYVDGKIDQLKSDVSKALNKQGQATAKLEGEVKLIEEQLHDSTSRLEGKIDAVQENLTSNFNELTVAITRLAVSEETTAKAVDKMELTLREMSEVRHHLDEHEVRIKNIEDKLAQENREQVDLQKERIKGRFALVAAVVALIGSVVCALIAALVK